MEPDLYTDLADALAARLTELTGQPWTRHSPGAALHIGPVRIVAHIDTVRAYVGDVSVALHAAPYITAIPLLRDPAALRTRVREELARALATIDTEPTS
jgi:hypothetical protein